jgi:hypothetical protein
MGVTGPVGALGTTNLGNVALVDAVNGNDSTAVVGGKPFLTVHAAIAAVASGQHIWVLPGTYNLTSGITIPSGTSIRGASLQTCIIQMLNVTSNTTLINMGVNTRLEDFTILLTSAGHYTLTGIAFSDGTTTSAKVRTCVVTVNNSSASSSGSSTVTGILCSGTGTLGTNSFSFNSLEGSTLNIYSNGGGNKRGILINNTNVVSTRDANIYIAQPTSTASTGSYVGVECADPNNSGAIQLRSTTVGTTIATGTQGYVSSDILQTNPPIVTNPTYLASPGIQIGPGVDLVTKTAGGLGFSSYCYPTTVYYGLKGLLHDGANNGYLWPGTLTAAGGGNGFPDTTTPAAFYRAQQTSLLSGMAASLNTAPGGSNTVTITIQKTIYANVPGGSPVNTAFAVTFGPTDIEKTFYSASTQFLVGDRLHVYVSYTGGNGNAATDLSLQLDMF